MVTPKQIAALKYLIFHVKTEDELSKRLLAFLIDQSAGLIDEVCCTLTEGREGYSGDEIQAAADAINRMQSCNCTTHLHALTCLMGSDLAFSYHYGDYDPTRKGKPLSTAGQFQGWEKIAHGEPELFRRNMPLRYTFWLAKERYSRVAKLIPVTREQLEQINLRRPGLYYGE